MGTKQKLIERFKRQPKDFTFDELVKLFSIFGYSLYNKGKTSGSRVLFVNGDSTFEMHKPHPQNTLKMYVMRNVLDFINENKLEEKFNAK